MPHLLLSVALFSGSADAAQVALHPGDDVRTLTASLGPGAEYIFHAGTYSLPGNLDWTGIGTEAEPIVLRTADDGDVVIEMTDSWVVAYVHDAQFVEIRGLTFAGTQGYFDDGNGYGGLRIENSANVTVEDCVFERIGSTAVAVDGNNDSITFRHNEITNTRDGTGIYFGCGDASCWTQNSTVDLNWIHDLGGDYASGIVLEAGSQNIAVDDNVVYNIAYRGIHAESTEYAEANTIEGNAVWGIGDAGIAVYGREVVRNNVVFDIDNTGIRTGQADGRVLEKQVISFNTVVNTGGWGIQMNDWQQKESMVLANNVVANPTGYAFRVDDGQIDAGAYVHGNVFTGLVEGIDLDTMAGAFSAGGGYLDFVDAETWDFYPETNASIVDSADPAGDAFVPDIDFNGSVRDGAFPDVGAYEQVSSDNPGWTIQEGFKTLTDGTVGGEELGGGCCGKNKSPTETDALVLLPLIIAWRRRAR
jgi:hypothetical protein